ncbi:MULTISPECIES: DUF2934 domain-containing protein [unclassified Caballeronia]|uniref:DUF2934 domain-containing protein n=1 Tax=unclassified Caballeronia TaxID=2646786 RepID=UPI0028631CDF|nr:MULTISPECIES: DUF2934 domain-containing protein [unclassified Caballeronia]MDR5763165.1 DUF2934 domain-containing protein [Caballeronia sp. LZ035]MDR5883965.1 DUF2934 domain-containing protein [Caballeronia sp. LZ032]
MNVPTTEEQIRALAHRLWEEAGRPEGRSEDFWILAQQQLASEPGMGSNTFDRARTGGEGSKPDL